ncbi:Lrp/AsnC family transcriptional regulator [Saccharothrix algeriensis]|uniref:DNA-binding Lrp family transcriptional regulator n=1 Tax=Saccharothrix algeriensis TaxID=173560 RepID=A0A8T8HVW5_9PSEU|nr:Lrp/AsnC family transcriptional regulator [Saccharothrix algeriensis]MBM7814360.1 DNA-binding Lrp family transcriptional regulator [Saccharothrix algeriensis]QTR02688.1 Lrp/AsnC family transcriptional regulator [Saccharothrix algeriensis]
MPEPLVDAIDHEILALLREDARRTLSDIAGRVTLSTAAVKRRIDRLQQVGVITGFTVQVDHAKLGWGIEAFTELRFAGTTKVADILGTTTRMPEAQAVFTIAGDPDALVWLRVRDMAHLQRTIDEIRRHHQVTGTKTLIALDSWARGQDRPTR